MKKFTFSKKKRGDFKKNDLHHPYKALLGIKKIRFLRWICLKNLKN